MRATLLVRLLVIVVPLALTGCKPPESTTTEAPTTPPSAALPSDTTSPPAAGPTGSTSGTGLPGSWGMVMGTLVLKPDGTGRMSSTMGGEPDKALTWREEGDGIVVSIEGEEQSAKLTESGGCLVVSGPESPLAVTCVRLDAAEQQQLAQTREMSGPAFAEAREKARQVACLSNEKQLSLAMVMYATDYDDNYPRRGGNWEELTYPYVKNESIYACPSDDQRRSYQFNPVFLGTRPSGVTQPAWTVMLFESDDGKQVAYRHSGGANYGFADGHCKWLLQGEERQGSITWKPAVSR